MKRKLIKSVFLSAILLTSFAFGACGKDNGGTTDNESGVTKPEQKPEDKPEQKPDDKPEQKPDDKPAEGVSRPVEGGTGSYSDSVFYIPGAEKPVIGEIADACETNAMQGYESHVIATADRNVPSESMDGGLASGYPAYSKTLSLTAEQKQAIIAENDYIVTKLTSSAGTYDKLDKDGYLYLSDGTPVLDEGGNHRRIYKHSASVGLYGGDVSPDEQAVVKSITFKPRMHANSYSVTGLYAPAGEVIKIEIPAADMDATGGVTVYIGQALYSGGANNIWAAKEFSRMPVLLNKYAVNKANCTLDENKNVYYAYVGSYLGGPIYIGNTTSTLTATVYGAVQYRHFILGKTTKSEFEALKKCTAPYFDLEVWSNGVLHSGPVEGVKDYSYDDLYKAAVLWEKIAGVSTQVRQQGIVFLYDCFVAAGAAVAFVGRYSVNCPTGWMANALDYNTLVTSGGWGNVHEYNHNFQGWGLDGGGEVTNNALTLVSYSQFTKISSARTLTASGETSNAWWNHYTSGSWALKYLMDGHYTDTEQLTIYSTLLHNIGAESFTLSAKRSGADNYYTDVCNQSHYDMTYFFENICGQALSSTAKADIAAKGYEKFVPVACVYQTGRSVTDGAGGGKYITTMQPYEIKYGEDYDIDLSPYTVEGGVYRGGSIVLPQGFSYTVKGVNAPKSVTLTKKGDKLYTLAGRTTDTGKIVVTLGITKDDGAFTVADVDLVLEFRPTHEVNKSTLERTVYTYDQLPYKTATEAYEAAYAGYADKREEDNINPTQNSNTDIWVPDPSSNAVMEVKGKLYVNTEGDYRIALRGRHHAALYISTDGENYTLAAKVDHNTNNNGWWLGSEDGYIDLIDLPANSWIYFKEVLLIDYSSAFVGLGTGKFEVSGTMNENGQFVDASGNVIDESEARTVTITYAAAFRNSYQFPENSDFESDYLFPKRYTCSYSETTDYGEKGTLVESVGYTPWPNAGYSATLEELFDDNDENFIHSAKSTAGEYDITEATPFDITVDLGSAKTLNRMTIYGEPTRAYQPKNFLLYGGLTPDDMTLLKTVTGARVTNNNVVVDFEDTNMRYYRLYCTETYASGRGTNHKYIAYRYVKFSRTFNLSGGTMLSPDDEAVELSGSWKVAYASSEFGRVYLAGAGAEASFTFTGTRVAFAAKNIEGYTSGGYTVYIDGAIATADDLLSYGERGYEFFSGELAEGEHVVRIVYNGPATLSAVTYW